MNAQPSAGVAPRGLVREAQQKRLRQSIKKAIEVSLTEAITRETTGNVPVPNWEDYTIAQLRLFQKKFTEKSFGRLKSRYMRKLSANHTLRTQSILKAVIAAKESSSSAAAVATILITGD